MDFIEGIFFGLPETDYHSVNALSASGIKKMRVSTADFWYYSNFNPRRAELESREETFAKLLGAAYHHRLLFGRESFYRHYAPRLERADVGECLDTNDDLQSILRRHNEQCDPSAKMKIGGNKSELIERVLAVDPGAKIWDVVLDSYHQEHAGKIFLPASNIERIEIAAAIIEGDPELSKTITGGAPECSIFWTCPTIGTPMKCRVDFLKPQAIIEVKSFSNPNDRPVEEAIETALVSRRYHIGAALYSEGVSHVARIIKEGKVFGEIDPAFVKKLAADHPKKFCFLWQSTGAAQVARGFVLPETSYFFQNGQVEVESAKQKYRTCLETYGTDLPWLDREPIKAFDDARLPIYGLK